MDEGIDSMIIRLGESSDYTRTDEREVWVCLRMNEQGKWFKLLFVFYLSNFFFK
jgi:hypothetical protein